MSNKIEIDTLESLSANDATATLKINNNFKKIRDELNNTLSRDGKTPNFMDADLDLNSHKIINSADPEDDKDLVTLKYLKQEIGDAKRFAEEAEASANRSAEAAADSKEAEKSAIQYAIGFPEEPVNHSAKWWAEHPDLSVVPSREEFEALEDTVQMHDSDIHQLEQDKQDKLVAGEGIAINGNVISNTQTSAEWGKIIGDITEQADLQEALDNIVSRGTINKNDGSTFYDWIGTLQEYTEQRVRELHPDWLVYITDDVTAGAFTYTKEAIDAKFANVPTKDDIDSKADDSSVVHKSGAETITGVKDFASGAVRLSYLPLDHKMGLYCENEGNFITYENMFGTNLSSVDILSNRIKLNATQVLVPDPTEQSSTSVQADTVGARERRLLAYATWTALENKIKLVSVLPAEPGDNVLYVIPE